MGGDLGSSNLFVRAYRPSDLDATISIFLESIRISAARDYAPAQIDSWAQVAKARWSQARSPRTTWMALMGADAAGFAELNPPDYVNMMFVRPRYQRAGVASALLESLRTAAVKMGVGRLSVSASVTARPFFEKRGFCVVASQVVALRGSELMNYKMETSADWTHERGEST